MFFVGSEAIMQTDTAIAPERTTLEAVETMLASFVAISALDS